MREKTGQKQTEEMRGEEREGDRDKGGSKGQGEIQMQSNTEILCIQNGSLSWWPCFDLCGITLTSNCFIFGDI